MPSIISRVVVASIFIIVCYVLYSNYITENTKLPEVKPPEQNVTCSKNLDCTVTNITGLNPAKEKQYLDEKFNGLYLYNPQTDNLYLKRPNPDFNSTNPLAINKTDTFLYYQAGKGIDCPGLISTQNSSWKMNANSSGIIPPNYVLIQDSYVTLNCSGILNNTNSSSSFREQCGNDPTQQIVVFSSASEYENKILEFCEKQGNTEPKSPHPNVCKPPDRPVTERATLGGDPTSPKYTDFSDFLYKEKEMILALAGIPGGIVGGVVSSVGEKVGSSKIGSLGRAMGAVSSAVSQFMMISLLFQGVLNSTPGTWQATMAFANAGEMVLDKLLESFIEKVTTYAVDKGLMEAAENATIQITSKMTLGSRMLLRSLQFAKAFESLTTGLGYLGLINMIIDTWDPCGFSDESSNLKQEMFDKMRFMYDKGLFEQTGGLSFPTRIDPSDPNTSSIIKCEYKINCEDYYNNCLTNEDKSKTTLNQYCKDDQELHQKYMNEYLSTLKTNSVGECIGKITNDVLASYFNTYVGGIDWSFIKDMKPSDFKLSKDQQMKVVQLLLANENTIVASYINHNFYYFLAAFIIIVIIMFMV